MNRSPSSRFAALLVAVLLLLSWGEQAFGMRPCPHHERVAGAEHVAAERDHAEGHEAHAGAAHHASTESHHAQADGHHESTPESPGSHGGECTCSGGCPSAAFATLPGHSEATLRVAPARIANARPAEPDAPAGLLSPYFLPPSHAPPSLS